MKTKKIGANTDAAKVNEYMDRLVHPLKVEIDAVRLVIKNANAKIAERIKWNAPSYYYKEDLVTFNTRPVKHVHLVFHNAGIVNIKSSLLEGDYKDRRMAYFTNMADVQSKKKELEVIINELIKVMDNK
jgi:uncharacterized protein YdhG (YjbR/CyaY superfamily)